MSTHNICFHGEIRKIICGQPFLSGNMIYQPVELHALVGPLHYENTPIQIYRKFRLQKLKNFR